MAVYKVIQDIEAEDKLLGPLTLKGFVYAIITVVLAFINFRILISPVPVPIKLTIFLVLCFPMILFGVLASPLGREQPTEVWLLSRIRFFLKPRKRIWSQFGISELVTITVPKRIERQLTKGFTQTEVESRLKALALTLDSRGWAVKNVNVNLSANPDYLESTEESSDRLVATSTLPSTQPVADVQASDDILDVANNATAKKFDNMMKKADEDRKKKVAENLKNAQSGKDQSQEAVPSPVHFVSTTVIHPGQHLKKKKHNEQITDTEADVLNRIHKRQRTLRDSDEPMLHLSREKVLTPAHAPKKQAVTSANQAVKLELAQSGSDLSVASIASLANRKESVTQSGPNEVTISLH